MCIHKSGIGDCDCVPVFVSGWVLGCSLSWISLGPLSNVEPRFSPPYSLQLAGVSACWCIGGFPCPGLGALVCAGSLPAPACRGLGPLALLGGDVPQGLGSLAGSALV
ncbi:hypothetical protein ATANTOWER_005281 [Ataeniobius toweri]|uniref:Uncharacterized protein n=1 Tax=Ataeniobius toweri TaxID=208326 RepID=A0ABU7ASX8_9TELE|nr:hypothetical protein [Ataeniobius toweri]